MAASLRERQVAWLTANCDCWKGQTEALNEMTDEQLGRLAANANKLVRLELTLNAATEVLDGQGYKLKETPTANGPMPAFVKDDEEEEVEEEEVMEDEEEEEYPPVKNKKTCNEETPVKTKTRTDNARPKTYEEWLAIAPPEVRERDAYAKQLLTNEKAKLVRQLIANVKGPEKRKAMAANFLKRPLPELRDLVELLPAPAANARKEQSHEEALVNSLAAGGADVANAEDEYEGQFEALTPPTINWSEAADLAAKKPDAKQTA